MQRFERLERNDRRAHLHRCTRFGVQHPQRQNGACPIGEFADGYCFAATVLAIRNEDFGPKRSVPSVMHLRGASANRRTINGDLLWAEKITTGASPS